MNRFTQTTIENKNKILLVILVALVLILTVLFLNSKLNKNSGIDFENKEYVFEQSDKTQEVVIKEIGTSVLGRKINSYSFGDLEESGNNLLFIGGIHGGYEWNSILLSYEMIDYFNKNISTIPENISITIVPNANPDGLFEVIGKEGRFTLSDVPEDTGESEGKGRFNANNVDLNRNFNCKWSPESSWKGNIVSAGSYAFSEPEASAVKKIVEDTNPKAVIFWHSKANNVYASECEDGILPNTLAIMNSYANSANYGKVESFDAYEITGDAEGWLASIGIPAITVELKTRNSTEFEQNLNGVKTLIDLYK